MFLRLDGRRRIPRRDAKEIAAEAHQRGSAEKVATTTIKELVVNGVKLISRYGFAEEYETMQDIVLSMGPFAGLFKSIHCDSKAGHCFSAVLREWGPGIAQMAALALQSAVRRIPPQGHNGISVAADDGSLLGDDERHIELPGGEWVEDVA